MISWVKSCVACKYVLSWYGRKGGVGYLQLPDGEAGMAAEEEHAGEFILEAARVRRSLGAS